MNVTALPKVEGFSEDVSVVVVVAWFTVWTSGDGGVLGAKLVSPL